MTDAEISRALALAIGWPDWAVATGQSGRVYIWTQEAAPEFDYRDPAVIWPIAERYNCFPSKASWGGGWRASAGEHIPMFLADTAAKAVALAVIAGARVPRVEQDV